jgi:hypothetical protein
LGADENLLSDAQIGKQERLLVHRRHAQTLCLSCAFDRERAAMQQDLTAVGLMAARNDLDQRRLAGAIFSQKRMDLSGVK